MNGMTRAGATLLGAAAAGVLLWVAAQIGRHSTGGYWAAYGIVAGAGLVFALTQLRGRNGHPPGMFLIGFLPVLIVAGWIIVAMQPDSNTYRNHVLSWSGDMGTRDVVRDVGTWLGVLAFGIGYTLGATLEPMRRRTVAPAPAPAAGRAGYGRPGYDGPAYEGNRAAADEPVAAERRELDGRDEPVEPSSGRARRGVFHR
ncbi:MAG: hypothetical protein ACRDM1_03750 [Gaiellaceae bacterium]